MLCKKILVVSDNPTLVTFFKEECLSQGVAASCKVDYRYSEGNKWPDEMIRLGLTPVNIKDPSFLSYAKSELDIIFSVHCKQIFPADLVSTVTCVNIHPGFNPYNRGWYPQVFSIINGSPVGATIHVMNEAVDHGDIIDQAQAKVLSSDTSLDVYQRVVDIEKILIKNNLLAIVGGEYSVTSPTFDGNYNSIEDFRALCKLNLDNRATLKEHINLLRALSHGEFKNAYFIDELGKKVFVQMILTENY